MARFIVCNRHTSNIASQKNYSYLMSLQRCVRVRVRVCVRGEGDSHRAEPREEFTRSPWGFLFVLLEENFLLTRVVSPVSVSPPPPPQVYRTRSEETKLSRSPPGSSRVGMRTFPGSSEDFTITQTQIASAIP